MHIKFMGAARNVTGSRHLIYCNTKNILLDCGMFQDKVSKGEGLNENFGFDPAIIDYVILSHAHIDHAGCLPRLVKEGFRGPIFATPATIDLCAVMLADSARIQESDVKYKNKRLLSQGKKPLKPLYTERDTEETMRLFVAVEYNTPHTIEPGIRFLFTDAGHIIGSAAIHLELTEKDETKYITFTGDIGRYHDLILKEPQKFPQADYIICESTYGDRLHEELGDAAKKLLEIVKHTCLDKKGKLIIPAFSLGRTQEIVYTLDRMHTNGLLPHIPIYVDSPLSTSATDIMRKYSYEFNDDIQEYMRKDPNPFGFRELRFIREVEDSKALTRSNEPCIIISASGMADAGRIKHHLRNNIGDERNTVLMVGYCSPYSLGRQLMDGAKEVKIFGELHSVIAEVISLQAYSAHADYKEMLRFLECQDPRKIKRIFLVHGEIEVQEVWRKKLIEAGFKDVVIPEFREIAEI
ncbi:MAG: MBL fold metallo-hydrolase [Bacteroidota bacterium]|nr:MBL fold metallo-hydrolase [Bacteroidota bacterium]